MLFTERNVRLRPALYAAVLVPSALLYLLLVVYGAAGWAVGAVCSVLFTATVFTGALFYRYIPGQASFPYIKIVYVTGVLLMATLPTLAIYSVVYKDTAIFGGDFMLFAVTGFYLWFIVIGRKDREPEPDAVPSPLPEQVTESERVTVKKGNNIHIIEKHDILYIAAMGDYVSIVTADGRYIKEGTMVHYERTLGQGFARIHRSTIVNISKISAVELYGKNSYNIKIASGESLRASAAGYRSLRGKLGY